DIAAALGRRGVQVVVQGSEQISVPLETLHHFEKTLCVIDRRRVQAEPERIGNALRQQDISRALDVASILAQRLAAAQVLGDRASVLVPEYPRLQGEDVVVHDDELT